MSTEQDLVAVEILEQEVKSHGLWCHKGEIRKIERSVAKYFIQHGWAKLQGSEAAATDLSEKTLDVQGITHKSAAASPSV